MTSLFLIALFLVSLMAPPLGLDLSLAPGLSVKNAFLYGLAAALLLESALLRNRRLELLDVVAPLMALVIYALFTWLVIVLVLQYQRYSAVESLILLKSNLADYLLVFLVFFYGARTAEQSVFLLRSMVFAVIFANVVTVLDGLDIPDMGLITADRDGRIGGPVGRPNEYGALVAFFLPATIAVYFSSSRVTKALVMVGVLASLLALLMTVSRGAFAGIIIGVTAGCILLRRMISARDALVGVALITALLVVGLMVLFGTDFGDLLRERLVQDTRGSVSYVSSGRSEIWRLAVEKMLEHPYTLVTGFGWNAYESSRWFWAAPHNLYLFFLFNTGLIGLTLFVSTSWNVIRRANAAIASAGRDETRYLVATAFGLLCVLASAFFGELQVVWFYVWAYCGVAMRLALCVSNNVASPAIATPGQNSAVQLPARAVTN